MVERSSESWILPALHIFTLTALWVVQPLLVVLGQEPPFFAAHDTESTHLAAMLLAFGIALPASLVAVEVAAGWISTGLRRALHLAWIGTLCGAGALLILNPIPGISENRVHATAIILAIASASAYARFRGVRLLLSVASPVIVLVPGLFLLRAEIWQSVLFPETPGRPDITLSHPAPVVFVVFDGLRLSDLMDASGGIDASRMPNFAALAEDATWYRNATTVAASTVHALPAILTGLRPSPAWNPQLLRSQNLFSLLEDSHEVFGLEPVTSLCPRHLCRGRDRARFGPASGLLIADSAVVYLNTLLPVGVRMGWIPEIGDQWSNFGWWPSDASKTEQARRFGRDTGTRVAAFDSFLEAIAASPRPTLHFIHSMLPHGAFAYFPSGRRYNHPPPQRDRAIGTRLRGWMRDELGVFQAEKRYLMQVGLVDELVGRLRRRLEDLGLYDQSVLVVTSDHGWSFLPGERARHVNPRTQSDILPIPLFIKRPGQEQGSIDDRLVQSVDILPMLLEILGAEVDVEMDGRDTSVPALEQRIYYYDAESIAIPEQDDLWRESLARRLARFGADTPFERLLQTGEFEALHGLEISEFELDEDSSFEFTLEDAQQYRNFDPNGQTVPAFIHGRLLKAPRFVEIVLAATVNGRVAGVTTAFGIGNGRFQVLVPEASFRPGENKIALWTVDTDKSPPHLSRIRRSRQ